MNIEIIGFRLPTITPDPSRHSSCGWIAICDGKEVGWCNMSFLPDNTLKFEDSFVHPDYRGRGIYKMLWNKRMDYYNSHLNRIWYFLAQDKMKNSRHHNVRLTN